MEGLRLKVKRETGSALSPLNCYRNDKLTYSEMCHRLLLLAVKKIRQSYNYGSCIRNKWYTHTLTPAAVGVLLCTE